MRVPAAQIRNQCCGESRFPGASAVVISRGDIVAAGSYDSFGRAKPALYAFNQRGDLDMCFGQGGRYIGPYSGSDSEVRGLAAAPGGSVIAVGFSSGAFTSTSGFAVRFG